MKSTTLRRAARNSGGAEKERAVGPGDLIFVPAREKHRFVEIEEPLRVLVFFGPAEAL